MTEYKLTPTCFTISDDAAYKYNQALMFSTPHIIGVVIEEIREEFMEQHPYLATLQKMPLLEGKWYDYIETLDEMERTFDKIRKGTASADDFKALQEGTPERLNQEAFLKEQFSFYKEMSGNEAEVTFEEMVEIITDYRFQMDTAFEAMITRKIHRFGA